MVNNTEAPSKICPNCNEVYFDEDNFCGNDGSPLKEINDDNL
jgi:hypothetical protein